MTALSNIKVVDALEGRLWAVLPAGIGLFYCMHHSAGFLFPSAWMVFWAMIMAGHDIDCRRIPNPLTAMAAICGIMMLSLTDGYSGLIQAICSFSFIFIIMAILFFMGIVGGGDAKAVAALATFIPVGDCIAFLICISLAGGIQAIIQLIINKRISDMLLLRASTKNWRAVGAGLTLPYGVAILGGCILLTMYNFF
ncbi:membrane protein containing Peptidase A24A, prepilin type IV domain protein [Candidatus Magnetomorum sp. HK-1]|nr:membrane protein containing Peptidase A24A, prepilin type IV domain protein [Candidatus Magnetomorum sp. HK-1]